jgi:Family of unknown function (DUF6084)
MSAAVPATPHHAVTPIPELRFEVRGASSVDYAAVPTIAFSLAIEAPSGRQIRSLLLDVQIQIAARQRGYTPESQERLLELFGTPDRWRATLRTLPWTRTTVVVPPFEGATVAEVPIPCTYDLEVTAARYLAALDSDDGEVPLELLLSGTVFFSTETAALQATRIAWDHELEYRMPVAVWRQAMDRHFPNSAWLRCSREQFERLWEYRSRHALTSWDATVAALLEREGA